jgi:hypothetical protein
LARIAHVVAVRALGEFVAQVWQRDGRAIPLKQPVNAVLTASAALSTRQSQHMQLGSSLAKRVRTVWHRHNQLSAHNARSI